MGAMTLADGRRYVGVTLNKPAGYDTGEGVLNISLATLGGNNSGFLADAYRHIWFPDWKLGPTGSDKKDAKTLGTRGKAQIFTESNFDGNLTIVRQMTDGVPNADDKLFLLVAEKGIISYWLTRNGKFATVPLALGDKGYIYECMSDDPKEQEDEADVMKNNVPIVVLSRREYVIVA